jgi:hypothetical protein
MKGVKSFRVMKDSVGKTYKVVLGDILSRLKKGWELQQKGVYLLSPDGQRCQYLETTPMRNEIIKLLEANWTFGLTDEKRAKNLEYTRTLRELLGGQIVYPSTTDDLPFADDQKPASAQTPTPTPTQTSTPTPTLAPLPTATPEDPMALKLLNMILSNNVSGLTITTLENGLWSVSGKIHLA